MQKPTQKIKVFIDTNVLIAGVNSVTGASATLLDLCEARVLQMVVSRQVLIETDRILTVVKPHGGHKHCHWLDVKDVIKVLEED